jgi:hypothetical protein
MGAMRADTHFKKKRCNTTIIDDEKKQNTGKKRRHWQRGPKKKTLHRQTNLGGTDELQPRNGFFLLPPT